MSEMDKLIEAVEAGTAKATDFRTVWRGYAGSASIDAQNASAAYNGSLDAALRLHTALLPGASAVVQTNGTVQMVGGPPGWERHTAVSENNPARAWLLSILRAVRATKGDAP